MEPGIVRGLNDKLYEKRKAAALDLEKLVRDSFSQGDTPRIIQVIEQLVELFATPSNALHARNGGLIGLAATAIALGVDISPFMERFIDPLLSCFADSESRIRYFACESMYNIAKVSKGEILVYFNPIFDALSKLAADSELSVKNGAELLDRLLKDIVAESAPIYFPQYPETERVREEIQEHGIYGPRIMIDVEKDKGQPTKKAFSLAHFMPLLSERIYVISPFTRSYLVSWITVLDSVPDLELVSFLPEFLDGLIKYLSDPTEDVRVATENLMADFLHEIRGIALSQQRSREKESTRLSRDAATSKPTDEPLPDITVELPERGAFITGEGARYLHEKEEVHGYDDHDVGAWTRGQSVSIDYAAIVEILIQQLDSSHDEIQQSVALRWIAEFLTFAQDVIVSFTPRLIPAILPNLAHHVAAIQAAANQTNQGLFAVVQNLPDPPEVETSAGAATTLSKTTAPTSPTGQGPSTFPRTSATVSNSSSNEDIIDRAATKTPTPTQISGGRQSRASTLSIEHTSASASGPIMTSGPGSQTSRPVSPTDRVRADVGGERGGSSGVAALTSLWLAQSQPPSTIPQSSALASSSANTTSVSNQQDGADGYDDAGYTVTPEEIDPFDYQRTVNALTVQFISEHVETRVAALEWLLMLHSKASHRILAIDDGTFPVLLKTLSDPSEEVIKRDLQLLAQISSNSEEGYFRAFMMNLLEIFNTDRRLLEARGSLIIRQLCLNLNTERIYRTFAEILDKEEDLDFASTMVQRLNVILITSPELSDFRKRLKNLESRDAQILFSILYRSWCHNPVAVLTLCLLAQAYEHASNLLPILADLEITVQLLVQIDKLVQLIESPVFTSLRLQLLEPEKYPYLFKCLYGILMLLPQSSAFISLRNRLNAVSSLGFLHVAPRPGPSAPTASSTIRSKLGTRDGDAHGTGIKWQDHLAHFRQVQLKHEKARRGEIISSDEVESISMSSPANAFAQLPGSSGSSSSFTAGGTIRPQIRRKVTDGSMSNRMSTAGGGSGISQGGGGGGTVLSPLNPKARNSSISGGMGGTTGSSTPGGGTGARSTSPGLGPNRQRRALGINPRR